ncbi:hypothetical protein AVEN_35867-1 [Araneus ventricosus]|uniref:Uncharacterized protein n=1 Tax=Araneus ventricosus TaxID=182803 RepID=A0A4Y2BKU5_ARAVE|nr:hypothetical protein AVEN_35867-1 [Araneus ventricosus]
MESAIYYVKLGIHDSTALLHFNQQPVCFPPIQLDQLRRSFTEAPPPPHGGFRFLERALSPLRSDFSSVIPTHIPHNDPYPRMIVFHFYGRMEIQKHWNSKLSLRLRQFSSGFHIDEWVWHPVFQRKVNWSTRECPALGCIIESLVNMSLNRINGLELANFQYYLLSKLCKTLM